jgi:hypothetical protein
MKAISIMKKLFRMRFPAILLIGLFSALALAGCRHSLLGKPSEESAGETGSIELSFGSGARTITPSNPQAYTISSYSVSGSGPSGAAFPATSASGSTFTKTGLAVGSWTFTVQGLNLGGHVIAQDSLSLTISAGQTSHAAATLARVAGTGTIDLTLTWATAGDCDEVSGTITPTGGAAESLSLTIGGTSAHYTATKGAGDYLLNLSLKKTGAVIDTLTEAVQVYDGYTSSASISRAILGQYVYTSASPVYPVDFAGSASLNLTVSGAAGKSVYLVKENTASTNSTLSGGGSAASVREVVPYSQALVAAPEQYLPDPSRVRRMEKADAAAFNANPPVNPSLAKSPSLLGIQRSGSVTYGAGASGLVQDTSTKQFWVQSSTGAWVQITATLRAIGQYCYVWVNNANYSATSALDNDNLITSAQALALMEKFDGSSAASYNDGIFKNDTNVFGYEYGGGSGGDGGRDGDQHIAILVYDIDGDYASTQSGGVLGYFWGKDYYDQATLDAALGAGAIKTNYNEMFYIDCHFTDHYPSMITSTLAHEYQHMIHFNIKSLVQGLSSPAWYNEMCSMVAEDLVLANIGLNPAIDGPIDRLHEYSYHYAESGVNDWLTGNDVLKSYASAFAFGAYLERNYGGAALFKSMVANASVGEASITAALSAQGYTDTFGDAFRHYGESLVFTDIPIGSAVKTLKHTTSATIGSISYTSSSVDYATIQQYNMSSGWVSGAYGLRIYDPSTSVALRSYGTSVHSKSTWQNVTGSLSISLTAPADSNVKFFIMVK